MSALTCRLPIRSGARAAVLAGVVLVNSGSVPQDVQVGLDPMLADGSLPSALVADFRPLTWATDFDLVATADTRVHGYVTFSIGPNEPRSIELKWYASKVTSIGPQFTSTTSQQVVSFKPTAVCRAASVCDSIYVAGWSERQRMTVIEQWRFENALVGETINPVTGETEISFTPPSIHKTLVLASTSVLPIEGMAFHPVSQDLMFMEYGPEAKLHRHPVSETGAPAEVLLSKAEQPELAAVSDVRVLSHQTAEYVLVLLDPPVWAKGVSPVFLVAFDYASSGSFDVEGLLSLDKDALGSVLDWNGWKPVH